MKPKYSSVNIKGLTNLEANALAIACENGDFADFLNKQLLRADIDKMSNQFASVDFSDSDHPDHEADFSD